MMKIKQHEKVHIRAFSDPDTFMALSRTAAGRQTLREHGKKPANDYADKGRKIGKLAKHVAKK